MLDISNLANKLLYNDRLVNGSSTDVNSRPIAKRFRKKWVPQFLQKDGRPGAQTNIVWLDIGKSEFNKVRKNALHSSFKE